MPQRESHQSAADFVGNPASLGGATEMGAFSVPTAEAPSDVDDRRAGGISVVPVPRREIARLEGTLRLDQLPRHRPAIVFDGRRPDGDTDDD